MGGARRLSWTMASVGFLAVSNIGLAAAANPAAPGDPLYPLDRGYETVGAWLGLGADHSAERFNEADTVLARGDVQSAVALAATALEGTMDAAPLRDLDPLLAEHGKDPALAERVRQLLAIARTAHDDPRLAGSVADAARDIHDAVAPNGVAPTTTTTTVPGQANVGNDNGSGGNGNGQGRSQSQGNGQGGNGNGNGKGQGNGGQDNPGQGKGQTQPQSTAPPMTKPEKDKAKADK
jgi:hypothetical protein